MKYKPTRKQLAENAREASVFDGARLPKNFGKMSAKSAKLHPVLAEIFSKPANPNEHLPPTSDMVEVVKKEKANRPRLSAEKPGRCFSCGKEWVLHDGLEKNLLACQKSRRLSGGGIRGSAAPGGPAERVHSERDCRRYFEQTTEHRVISVIIPTTGKGRDDYSLVGLLDSLTTQTKAPNEVLICLDVPDDGTLGLLDAWRENGHQRFDFRIFHRTATKTVERGGPGLAENIMFANVRGDVCIHMDSDGYVDRHMVEFVISQSLTTDIRCLWGQNVFHDSETGAKLPHADPRMDRYPHAPGIYKMAKGDSNGALWACPTKTIRDLGGHCMEGIDWRGQDSRLGWRLEAVCQNFLVTDKRFVFHHWGLPTQYSLLHSLGSKARSSEDRFRAAQNVKQFRDTHRMPQLGHCDPLICNGGAAGWDSYGLSSMYVEVMA